VANGCIGAILQATIAPQYQGRVFTLVGSVAAAMTPVGLLLATPLANIAGVRAWYVAGGIACAVLGASAFLVRPILQMEDALPAEVGLPAQPRASQ
jgi:DHA3 family macrolide efflux protein-like MFS transporter